MKNRGYAQLLISSLFCLVFYSKPAFPVTTTANFSGINDVSELWMPLSVASGRMWGAKNAGTRQIRITVEWNAIETAPGVYNWSALDSLVAVANSLGVTILPVVFEAPNWVYLNSSARARGSNVNCLQVASQGKIPPISDCQYYSNGSVNYQNYQALPPNPNDLANFVRAMVQRYPSDIFPAIEIWNEPNWCNTNGDLQLPNVWGRCWAPADPSILAQTMKIVYPAVKRVSAKTQVVLGSLSLNDLDFLHRYYLAAAGEQTFDVLGLHPYISGFAYASQSCANPWPGYERYENNTNFCNWSGITDVRGEMIANGDIGKPIWITEFGWSTDTISDTARSEYLISAFQDLGLYKGYVQKAFVYALSQDAGYDGGPMDPYGLLLSGGGVGESFVNWANWSRRGQEFTMELPSAEPVIGAYSWVTIGGIFNAPDKISGSAAALVIDGNAITDYPITVSNGRWSMTLQFGPWISAFGTSQLPEHNIGLRVWTGDSPSPWFYTTQSVRINWAD